MGMFVLNSAMSARPGTVERLSRQPVAYALGIVLLALLCSLSVLADKWWYCLLLPPLALVLVVSLDVTFGLYAMLFFFPMNLLSFDIGFTLTVSQLFLVLTCIIYVCQVLMGKATVIWHKNLKYLLVFLAVTLMSIVVNYPRVIDFSSYFVGTLRTPDKRCFVAFFKLLSSIAIVVLVANIVDRREKIVKCLKAFLYGVVIASLFGLFQFVSDYFHLGIVPLRVYSTARGIWLEPFLIQGFHRINALSLEPKFHAFYLAIAITVVIFFWGLKADKGKKILLGSLLVLFVVNLLLTMTRSVIIILLVSLPFTFFLLRKVHRRGVVVFRSILVVGGLVLAMLFLLVLLSGSFLDLYFKHLLTANLILSEHYSETSQLIIALRLIPANLLQGVGYGNFAFYGFKASQVMRMVHSIEQLMSMYLGILVETGIFGLFFFGLFLYKSFRSLYSKALMCESFDRWLALFVIASNMVVWILSLYFPSHTMFLIFYVLLGLMLSADKQLHRVPIGVSGRSSAQ
jgi:hypothetical protein